MQITREGLVKHYAALGDEELLAIDCKTLSEWAYNCYCDELERRNLDESNSEDPGDNESHVEAAPGWLETASVACSFMVGRGDRYAEDAAQVCAILCSAGIPSYVQAAHQNRPSPDLLTVMVPGALSLKASSILDRDWFNPEMEETWRAHFEELSDDELRALTAEDLCAGMLDRAARRKRVYEEALAARRSDHRED